MHLVLWVNNGIQFLRPDVIDNVVWAQLPPWDPDYDELREIVKSCMIHGPPRAQARIDYRTEILNGRQVSVLKSAFRVGDRDTDLFTLVVGPPGIGKTLVGATIAVEWCQLGHAVLVVCASNHGLGIVAKRVVAELNAGGQTKPQTWIHSWPQAQGINRPFNKLSFHKVSE